jgi:hypothetical protein
LRNFLYSSVRASIPYAERGEKEIALATASVFDLGGKHNASDDDLGCGFGFQRF